MEPVILAVVIGIAVYIGVVALIPKRILAENSEYTRSMLSQLERENAGLYRPIEDINSIMREQIARSNVITRVFFTLPGAGRVYPQLVKAGLAASIDKFVLGCLIGLLVLVFLLKGFGVMGVIAAIAATYFIAWQVVRSRIRKRNDAFINGFPDALDMIVRSVRSGYPLNAAVRMVAENMQPPISTEFKLVADETAYGSSLIDALQRLSLRIDEPDIRFFVVVLTVQQEVGGNLAEVLSNLAGIIRRRKHLRMKIKALTSEGRATAWVLGLLPVFVFGLIHFVAPHHLDPFFESHTGNMMLALAIFILFVGFLLVRKLIQLDV